MDKLLMKKYSFHIFNFKYGKVDERERKRENTVSFRDLDLRYRDDYFLVNFDRF